MLDFEAPASFAQNGQQMTHPGTHFQPGIKGPHTESGHEEYKIVEKEPRRVTEIRVYYDDQTYETFVPAKKQLLHVKKWILHVYEVTFACLKGINVPE